MNKCDQMRNLVYYLGLSVCVCVCVCVYVCGLVLFVH